MIKLVSDMLIYDEFLRPTIEGIRKRYKDLLMIKEFKWLNIIYLSIENKIKQESFYI